MARPTKDELKQREEFISLGLFVRDNNIYTAFEEDTKELNFSSIKLSYEFCNQCEDRYEIIQNKSIETPMEYYNALSDNLSFRNSPSYAREKKATYHSYTLVLQKEMKKAIEEKGDRFSNDEEWNTFVHLDPFYNEEWNKDTEYRLSNKEKQSMKTYFENINYHAEFKYLTIIEKDYRTIVTEKIGAERNTFMEIDLTKPLNELIEFVTTIKNDYDKNPNKISNFHNLIGLDYKDFKCSLGTCDIYKHKSPKTLSGKLMDTLFIYDCRKYGLNEDYIKSEINRYWNEVKNIHRETIAEGTYQKYYKFAIDYIDNKKFLCFIHGTE